jgi:hypothetical protein
MHGTAERGVDKVKIYRAVRMVIDLGNCAWQLCALLAAHLRACLLMGDYAAAAQHYIFSISRFLRQFNRTTK